MTLIVARQFRSGLRIFSDTKKTNPADVLKGINHSVLKAVIVNKWLCICFAGRIGRAYSAIRRIHSMIGDRNDLDNVLNLLLEESQIGSNDTDFIVANLNPTASLTKISNGIVEHNLDHCWIGSNEAFNTYQAHFHSPSIPILHSYGTNADILNTLFKMNRAFTRLVDSKLYEDVGGFTIEVATHPDEGFYYESKAVAYPGSPEIQPNKTGGIEDYLSSIGSYQYSLLTPELYGVGAVGAHHQPGSLGTLFYPIKNDNPILYTNLDQEGFIDNVFLDYGFRLKAF